MRRAPSSPAEILARRRAERAGDAVVRALIEKKARETVPAKYEEAGVSLERAVKLEEKGVDFALDHCGRLKRAHRGDVWHRLAQREAITTAQHAAIRRLERDLAMQRGQSVHETGERVFVDCSGNAEGVTQMQIDAGKRVREALDLVGPPASRVVEAILVPPLEGREQPDWREVVARITGENMRDAQSAILRFAAQALADVYEMLDKRKRGN
ncbi:MAG: hypothetical protein EBZ50_04530 [Alphaproteobacteria bacterium]|nr:hypothetical protein [Alphaproteobacteria bacterium]